MQGATGEPTRTSEWRIDDAALMRRARWPKNAMEIDGWRMGYRHTATDKRVWKVG